MVPGDRCRLPTPFATTVTSRPALGQAQGRDEAGQPGADHDDPPHAGTVTGRCSTSSVPWKIQSSRQAWRIWSP